MSKIKQPFDFLELSEYLRLKTAVQDNFALNHGEYRPLEELNKIMRDFGRDMLRNYLSDSGMTEEQVEQEIEKFEKEKYGARP